jgi:hypothetical protein
MSKMRHIVVPIIFACLFFSYEHPSACTVFYASIGDVVLAGNNEDWKNPNTKICFVPAKDGKYGGVYFGFDKPIIHGLWIAQGGMNEKGLFFDVTATKPVKVEIPAGPEKAFFDGLDLIRFQIDENTRFRSWLKRHVSMYISVTCPSTTGICIRNASPNA